MRRTWSSKRVITHPTRPSEILITDLHNYGMPFVRYETGDLGRLADTSCPCGRGLPRLEAIEGRVLDALRTADGRIVPGEFFPHLLKDIPELAQYRSRAEEHRSPRHLGGPHTTAVRAQRALLDREIGKVFGSDTVYEIQPVTQIPPLSSGKRRVTVGMGA